MKPSLILLVLCGCLVEGRGLTATLCSVCREPVAGSFYWVSSPARRERLPVCPTCAPLDTVCFVCGLPVKLNFQRLNDGRLLCEADARTAVFSAEAAQRVFAEVKRDLHRMFQGTGTLPDQNITWKLVNVPALQQLQEAPRRNHESDQALGVTRSRQAPSGQFEHEICVLDGLGPARLAAVAAHEWTHAWIYENVPAQRRLAPDAVEGFCELAAFRLMTRRHEEQERKVILANAYTRGQITLLADVESDAQFLRVVQWMKTGTEPKFVAASVDRLRDQRTPPPLAALWQPAVKTPVPETLVLKGLGGPPHRRYALINNRTLEPNETAAVRIGSSNVVVQCLAIRERSAIIQVRGATEPQELVLPSK